jgi:hypothetical protein
MLRAATGGGGRAACPRRPTAACVRRSSLAWRLRRWQSRRNVIAIDLGQRSNDRRREGRARARRWRSRDGRRPSIPGFWLAGQVRAVHVGGDGRAELARKKKMRTAKKKNIQGWLQRRRQTEVNQLCGGDEQGIWLSKLARSIDYNIR